MIDPFDQSPENVARSCRESGYGEAHDAHMAMNGECPWCGCGYDASAIVPDGPERDALLRSLGVEP